MARPSKQQPPARRAIFNWPAAILLSVCFIGGLVYALRSARNQAAAEQPYATYSRSESCRECHADEFKLWKDSHHALAERNVNPSLDSTFFKDEPIHHGSQMTRFKATGNAFEICPDGQAQNCLSIARVIGTDPLRQFLVPTTNGRLQVTELAIDPKKGDWFDVFGNDDRKPGEWGHWTGRGMNWNSMCAACHNTALRKNYETTTDAYNTTMAEAAVGCEVCHGAMRTHVTWQREHRDHPAPEPYAKSVKGNVMVDTCGTCHARRGELTDKFQPGDQFLDHYVPTIPDDTDIYYADGQIRDEDYEYVSFLGSRMHNGGVVCMDCHEPHSGKTRLPGNELCLKCHGQPIAPAPKIDPVAHSFHTAGKSGSFCIDCHMSQTTYMQRHPRHDHGFTVPDPLLTVDAGIPNACNKCHQDHTAQWALDATQKWYGKRMERFTRERARSVVAARRGDTNAPALLLHTLAKETNSLWRASEITLLSRWITEPDVRKKILENATAHDPLPRIMTARALAPLASRHDSEAVRVLEILARDKVRAVRVEAAQSLRTLLDTNSVAASDYFAFLKQNADQPSGAMQMGGFYFERGDIASSLNWFRRAVDWDTNSAPLRHELAVALNANGQNQEALEQLRAASRLAPNEAEYHYKIGLALAESGDLKGATAELEQTVAKDPQLADGWYNLGLAYSQANRLDDAIKSLTRAEEINAAEARYPYARATILARLSRNAEAKEAALHVLSLDAKFQAAVELLQTLDGK
jgi:tetratricopeptide (TPR) repeat protein